MNPITSAQTIISIQDFSNESDAVTRTAIQEIHKSIQWEKYTPKVLEYLGDCTFFKVAVVAEQVIGYAIAKPGKSERQLCASFVAVHKTYEKSDAKALLFRSLLDSAAQAGYRQMTSTCRDSSIAFYTQFDPEAKSEGTYKDGEAKWQLFFPLSNAKPVDDSTSASDCAAAAACGVDVRPRGQGVLTEERHLTQQLVDLLTALPRPVRAQVLEREADQAAKGRKAAAADFSSGKRPAAIATIARLAKGSSLTDQAIASMDQIHQSTPHKEDTDRIVRAMSQSPQDFLIAQSGKEIIGYLWCTDDQLIHQICVSKRYEREEGIDRQLLINALKNCKLAAELKRLGETEVNETTTVTLLCDSPQTRALYKEWIKGDGYSVKETDFSLEISIPATAKAVLPEVKSRPFQRTH